MPASTQRWYRMSAVRSATASTRPPQKPPTSTWGTAGGRKRARGAAVAVIADLLARRQGGSEGEEKFFPTPLLPRHRPFLPAIKHALTPLQNLSRAHLDRR